MKNVTKIFLIPFLLFVVPVFSQIPANVSRVTKPVIQNNKLTDSAYKFIELKPAFEWNSSSDGVYKAFIENEIYVDWPLKGQIIQRNSNNVGIINLRGRCTDLSVTSLLVTATPIEGGIAKSKTISVNIAGSFSDTIHLNGGDYSIKLVEYIKNGNIITNPIYIKEIVRVGVGEVFLMWGHSFMTGTVGVSSQSQRSRTVKTFVFDNSNFAFFQNLEQMPIEYQKIDENSTGPFAGTSWIFGPLGDSLVKKFDVPVLLYSSSFGGSNIYQNKQNITNQPFGYTWFGNGIWQNNGFPFKTVQAAFQRYVPYSGLRAVIVAHGVNDNDNTYNGGDINNFKSNFEFVINRIRTVEANNSPNLGFILGLEDDQFWNINNQILSIIQNDPNIYLGIDLRDSNTWGNWRDDSYGTNRGHYVGFPGLVKYLQLWNNAITTSKVNAMTPLLSSF